MSQIKFEGHSLGTATQRKEFLLFAYEIEPDGWQAIIDFICEQFQPNQEFLIGELGKRLSIYSSSPSVLVRYLLLFHEELDKFDDDLPDRAKFESAELWHEAVSRHFSNLDRHILNVVDRFERVLAVNDRCAAYGLRIAN